MIRTNEIIKKKLDILKSRDLVFKALRHYKIKGIPFSRTEDIIAKLLKKWGASNVNCVGSYCTFETKAVGNTENIHNKSRIIFSPTISLVIQDFDAGDLLEFVHDGYVHPFFPNKRKGV